MVTRPLASLSLLLPADNSDSGNAVNKTQLLLSAYDYMSISHYYNTRKQQVQRQNDEIITCYS